MGGGKIGWKTISLVLTLYEPCLFQEVIVVYGDKLNLENFFSIVLKTLIKQKNLRFCNWKLCQLIYNLTEQSRIFEIHSNITRWLNSNLPFISNCLLLDKIPKRNQIGGMVWLVIHSIHLPLVRIYADLNCLSTFSSDIKIAN